MKENRVIMVIIVPQNKGEVRTGPMENKRQYWIIVHQIALAYQNVRKTALLSKMRSRVPTCKVEIERGCVEGQGLKASIRPIAMA